MGLLSQGHILVMWVSERNRETETERKKEGERERQRLRDRDGQRWTEREGIRDMRGVYREID